MPEKEEKVIVPTGDYSFRMPSTVNLTMPVSVEPMEEEVPTPKPPAKPNRLAPLINLVTFLWKALGLALLMLAAVFALYWMAFRPDMRQALDALIAKFTRPAPPPPDMKRYVIARQAVLAEYPGGDGERYALEQGYPVIYLGEMHQLNDGRVWMRVQAQYGPAAQPYKVNGWMQADKLSE